MISMPISDYPASSSDKAQAQVLTERRGELSQKQQDVEQSNLPPTEKERISNAVGDEIQHVKQQREHKLKEVAYQKKQHAESARKADEAQAQRVQADEQQAQDRAILDVKA